MVELGEIIPLLWLSYIIACAFVLWRRNRGDWREWSVRLALASVLPGVGLLLLWAWKPSCAKAEYPELDALAAPDRRPFEALLPVDKARETDIVPVAEALLVSDHASRRRIMIELLKRDALTHIDILQRAVHNEDTETAHYATSALTELKRRLTLTIQELAAQLERNPDDPVVLESYVAALNQYIRTGFLDERTIWKYRYTMSNLLSRLIRLQPDSHRAYREKIDVDLSIGEWNEVERTARMYLERFPNHEDAYLGLMKVHYATRSREQLMNVLRELERSSVRLSDRGLAIVRFWREGASPR